MSACYRTAVNIPNSRLTGNSQRGGNVLGMLGMDIPYLKAAHIVAVDEIGVVDPADNAPDHLPLQEYVWNRLHDAVVFHDHWLAVRKLSTTS